MPDLTSPADRDAALSNAALPSNVASASTVSVTSKGIESLNAPAAPSTEKQIARTAGLGRVLVAIYMILAAAATFRSIFQIIRKFDEAPLAYLLSSLAGIVYIVATIALIRHGKLWRRVAWAALSFELVGVLVVGTLSYAAPQLFAHPSVWSWYGAGYLYIPLVLPVLGLIWLSRTGLRE